jgi:hypothetical protein
MRVLLALSLGIASGDFEFTDLLGRIQQTTLKFDQQAEDVKNREINEIHNIEMRERDVDRELQADIEKYHWNIPSASFLQKRRVQKNRVKSKPVSINQDVIALEQTEKQRELAEKNFLKVEKEIAELPDKLMRTKERQQSRLEVPLDDDDDDIE